MNWTISLSNILTKWKVFKTDVPEWKYSMVPGWYPSLGDEDPKMKVYLGKFHWVVRVLLQNRVGAKDEDLAARYS